jgi:TRAP transporter 4TM/12TM fusion protein
MVHLEALKEGMQGLPKATQRTLPKAMMVFGITISSIMILAGIVYYGMGWIKSVVGDATPFVVAVLLLGSYVGLVQYSSRLPDLEVDDPDAPVTAMPETAPTVKTGLHFILPVVMLIWCLMIERLSPGLSAFWACMVMAIILVSQKPLLAFFRGNDSETKAKFKEGFHDLKEGLIAGARNMIGIGVATATAGIIVGTVSLTGIGQAMTEIVEVLSGGSLLMVLVLTALISLVLGMGLPTTANYIVVASMMVGVVQELGLQHGLIVPAIAIHLFVFYFGIMADVTPPVGLASFAAAAISKGDPIRTGVQAFVYSTRTAILPFFFIYNTDLLLIGVDSWGHGIYIFVVATFALLLFSAATQGYFFTRSKFYESAALMLIAVTLFVPRIWMNMIYPPYHHMGGDKMNEAIMEAIPGERMKLAVIGEDDLGEERRFFAMLDVPEGETAEERLKAIGLSVEDAMVNGETVANVADLGFDSVAENAGLSFDDKIEQVLIKQPQPAKQWMYVPALMLLILIIMLQKMRMKREEKA